MIYTISSDHSLYNSFICINPGVVSLSPHDLVRWTDITEKLMKAVLNFNQSSVWRDVQIFSQQYLSYYPAKHYDVETQRDLLIEAITLSIHNKG